MRLYHNNTPKKFLIFVIIALIFLFGGPASANTQHVFAQTEHVCLNRENIPIADLHWVYVPESPDELYTEEEYFFLAGQLIANDVVDASDCPSGGLMLNGYANACGMTRAKETVITVQNLLNEPILNAYDEVGVPPVLLKQLIRYESQFWPAIDDGTHYGFGHLTNIGMRNALQWNPDLRVKVCANEATCATNIPVADQILASLVNTCEDCEYGIDLDEADRSVDILAESLLGFCFQSEQLVFNGTGWYSNLAVDYATIWKLTLMNYNSGSQCVFNAVSSTFDVTQGPMNWSQISANVSGEQCLRGLNYANDITAKYFDFPPSE